MAETPAFKQEKAQETIRRLNDANRHRQSLGSFPLLTVDGYQLQAINQLHAQASEISAHRSRIASECVSTKTSGSIALVSKYTRISNFAPAGLSQHY